MCVDFYIVNATNPVKIYPLCKAGIGHYDDSGKNSFGAIVAILTDLLGDLVSDYGIGWLPSRSIRTQRGECFHPCTVWIDFVGLTIPPHLVRAVLARHEDTSTVLASNDS